MAATGCSPAGAAQDTQALMAAAERRRQLQSHFRESDEPPQTPENRATKTWRRALRHEPDSPLEALALRGRNDGSEVMEDFFGRRRRVRRPAEAKKEPPTRKAPTPKSPQRRRPQSAKSPKIIKEATPQRPRSAAPSRPPPVPEAGAPPPTLAIEIQLPPPRCPPPRPDGSPSRRRPRSAMARLESPTKKLFKRAKGDVARLRQRLLNGERDASSVVKDLYEGRQKRIEADYDRNKVLLKQKHADERAYLASYQAAEAAQKRGPIQGERKTYNVRGVRKHTRNNLRGVSVENTVEGELPTYLHKGEPKVLPGVAKRLAWDRDRRRRTAMELKRHQRIEVQALERKWAKERAALASERRVEEMRLRELIAHATKTVADAEEAEAHRRALDARASGPRRWRRATDLEPDRVTTETRGKALLACDAAVARASLACAALNTYEPHKRVARPQSARPARPASARADKNRLTMRVGGPRPASAPATRPRSAKRPASAGIRPQNVCACCRNVLKEAVRLPRDFFFGKSKTQFCSLACAKEWNHRVGPDMHRGYRDMLIDMLVSKRDPGHAPPVEILNRFQKEDQLEKHVDQVFYRPSRSFYNGGAKVGPLSLASYDASKYTLEDSSYSVAESVKQRVGADFVAPEILKDLEDICTPSATPEALGSYASMTVDDVLSRHEASSASGC